MDGRIQMSQQNAEGAVMAETRKESCPYCFGTGRGGGDDANGVYRSSGCCFRCGGSGLYEYTAPTINGGKRIAISSEDEYPTN